jgi:tetratricopeptide (TPR) repeat protein
VNVDALFGSAKVALELGDFAQAEKIARELLEMHPTHQGGRMLLAQSLESRDAFEEMLEVLRPVLEEFPDHLQGNLLMASCLRSLNRVDQADEHLAKYQEGLKLEEAYGRARSKILSRGDDPGFLMELVETIYPLRPEDAHSLLNRVVAIDPRHQRAILLLGQLSRLIGDQLGYREAVELARQLRSTGPDNTSPERERGAMLSSSDSPNRTSQGNSRDAIAD